MSLTYPNSYSIVKDTPPQMTLPQLNVGRDDIYYKREVVKPRVYHKYINASTRNHIYGTDSADSLYGNVYELDICDLSTSQEDIILGRQRDF